MINVDLIRRRVLRALHEVGIYISCLQDREETALQRMHGQAGIEMRARVADYILAELGHEITSPEDPRFSQSRRAANALRLKGEEPQAPAPKRRGRPPKAKLDITDSVIKIEYESPLSQRKGVA